MRPPDRFKVKSPEMLSYVPRNFIRLNSNLVSLLPLAALVSSDRRFLERDRLLIYSACFVANQGLKSEIYYTFILHVTH